MQMYKAHSLYGPKVGWIRLADPSLQENVSSLLLHF